MSVQVLHKREREEFYICCLGLLLQVRWMCQDI